jgi:hypothetical protein
MNVLIIGATGYTGAALIAQAVAAQAAIRGRAG